MTFQRPYQRSAARSNAPTNTTTNNPANAFQPPYQRQFSNPPYPPSVGSALTRAFHPASDPRSADAALASKPSRQTVDNPARTLLARAGRDSSSRTGRPASPAVRTHTHARDNAREGRKDLVVRSRALTAGNGEASSLLAPTSSRAAGGLNLNGPRPRFLPTHCRHDQACMTEVPAATAVSASGPVIVDHRRWRNVENARDMAVSDQTNLSSRGVGGKQAARAKFDVVALFRGPRFQNLVGLCSKIRDRCRIAPPRLSGGSGAICVSNRGWKAACVLKRISGLLAGCDE